MKNDRDDLACELRKVAAQWHKSWHAFTKKGLTWVESASSRRMVLQHLAKLDLDTYFPWTKSREPASQSSVYKATVTYEGYCITLEPTLTSIATLVLLTQGRWFEKEIEFCRQLLQPGMVVIDVGANVGVYTFLAARCVGTTGRVYAIEPTPECVACLKSTVVDNRLDSCVVPIDAAVGSQLGQVFLVFKGASVFNRIVTDRAFAGRGRVKAVGQLTLDHLWESENKPRVDLIKIDVEGAELQVLQGSEQLLRKLEPIVMFENRHTEKISGAEPVEFLATLGYKFYTYERYRARLKQVDPIARRLNVLNLIAVPVTRQQSLPFNLCGVSEPGSL